MERRMTAAAAALFAANLALHVLPGLLLTGILPVVPMWLDIIGAVAGGFLLVSIAVNAVFFLKNRNKKVSTAEMMAWIEREKQGIERDFRSYRRSMAGFYALGIVYPTLLILSAYLLSCVLILHGFIWLIAAAVLCIFTYTLLRLLVFSLEREKVNYVLDRRDFPKLYQLVAECAERAGYRGKIELIVNASWSGAVFEAGGVPYLVLGGQLVRLLTREELSSVIYHELAHIINRDLKSNLYFARASARWERATEIRGFANWIPKFMLSAYVVKYLFLYQSFDLLTAIHRERLADAFAVECGGARAFTDGLAKTNYFGYYNQERRSDLVVDSEILPPDFYEREIAHFLECCRTWGEKWRENCLREITVTYSTHPSFSERMQAAGCEDFHVDFTLPSYDTEESDALIRYADRIWGAAVGDWQEIYTETVKKPKKTLADCERKLESGQTVDSVEIGSAVIACFDLGNRERGVELCDMLLARDPSYALALYYKGKYLLENYDSAGIEMVKSAIDINEYYLEKGGDLLNNYLLKLGDREQRLAIRDYLNAKLETYYNDKASLNEIKPGDRFEPTEQPEELISQLTARFSAYSVIDQIFVADKVLKSLRCTVFAVNFLPVADREECQKAYYEIYRCLDDRHEDYVLIVAERGTPLWRKMEAKGKKLFDRRPQR